MASKSHHGDFCSDPLWDEHLTLEGPLPEFTQCFQDTILTFVPCGFIMLSAPFYIWHLLHCPTSETSTSCSRLFILKLLFLLPVAITWTFDFSHALATNCIQGQHIFEASVVSPAFQLVSLSMVLGFIIAERKTQRVTSGVLFVFWILQIFASTVRFYTYLKLKVYESDTLSFVMFQIRFSCVLAEVILHCFAEKPSGSKESPMRSNPELESSFPSRLTFTWLNSTMLRGYREALTEFNTPDLQPRDKSSNVVPRFLSLWTKAATKARNKLKLNVPRAKPSKSHSQRETNSLLHSPDHGARYTESKVIEPEPQIASKAENHHPSLLWILFKTFWKEYFMSQIWKLPFDVLLLCNPMFLGALVTFVQDSKMQEWKGFVLAGTLFLSTVLQSVLVERVFHLSASIEVRLRAALISAIYRKALTIDNNANKDSTTAEVVNLMSVDVDHIAVSIPDLWVLWSSPFQIVMCFYLLYIKIGFAMFAGAGFLFLLIPVNGFIVARLGRLASAILKFKDERIRIMNELLSGIKIIKLYAWERSFEKRILAVRDKELNVMRETIPLQTFVNFSKIVGPFIVTFFTFLTFILTSQNHHLEPQTAFMAMCLLDIMQFAIESVPMAVTEVMRAVISAKRIGQYLFHDDLAGGYATKNKNAATRITIVNGTFSWNASQEPTLKNINLNVNHGSLVAVVGAVGSGKSSLLSAMLGEIRKLNGEVSLCGTIAYIPQEAWIQNDSLRNNILFGKAYDELLYNHCIEACALQPDLDALPDADMTEIGERGINLSGGQKQRVSLARAVYAQADIYLLDDPLSAVDSHVGNHIFKQVISDSGLLAGKARVLVTHGIHWLSHTDLIIVMKNGQLSESGRFDQLLSHQGAFSKSISKFLQADEVNNKMIHDKEYQELKEMILNEMSASEEDGWYPKETMHLSKDCMQPCSHKLYNDRFDKFGEHEIKKEHMKETQVQEDQMKDFKAQQCNGNLIEEEYIQSGRVKWSVFKYYAKSTGYVFVALLVLIYSLYIVANTAALLWLCDWTDDADLANFTKLPANSQDRMEKNQLYFLVFGLFGILQIIPIILFTVLEYRRFIHASRILHSNMLSRVIRAPMAFFDTTPLGRIMNRFSKDITELDENLPPTFLLWLDSLLMVVTCILIISATTPIFIAFIFPLTVVYFFIQRFYIATSQQLKRQESKTKSPIFSHFSETLNGASVIRAHGVERAFINESEAMVDTYQIFSFTYFSSRRWIGIRLDFIGSLTVFISTTIAVATRNSISGAVMGLIIDYALQITDHLNFVMRMSSDVETQIVAVERIKEYTEIDTEAPWEIPGTTTASSWPDKGHIQLESLCLRYREGLDFVLKDITLEIHPTEKVGIVGRTGAGKSSLTLALFRLVEPSGGRIYIDGVDISTIGLHDLRSRLTILPQDPVIFTGTLRQNLDPLGEHSDESVWMALQNAHLKDFVDCLPNKLNFECEEGGQNLSVGQKQLLSLSRALLRKTKVLVLDEATAAVDMKTDDLIQETIREEFKQCTVLTIAHRLNTVMDYDRILVMSNGVVDDFDTPENLLKKKDGQFYSLAKAAGIIS